VKSMMDRLKALQDHEKKLFSDLLSLNKSLDSEYLNQLDRSLPFADLLIDRWERARELRFGEGSSVYNSVLVIGNVVVGSQCWIGPSVILDGSGGLTVGNHCTISAGVQIYTHDNVKKTLSSGKEAIERSKVAIGNNVYIGPNSVITRGVAIGNMAVVGAFSFVNRDVPPQSIVFGQPAKVVGRIIETEGKTTLCYD